VASDHGSVDTTGRGVMTNNIELIGLALVRLLRAAATARRLMR
jgi:hypothetical protein